MTERIPIGIAGPDLPQISREYTALVAGDSRFVLAQLSSSWRSFQDTLQESEPSLLLIYADIAPSPDVLAQVLSGLKRAIAVILLPSQYAQAQGAFEKIHSVRRVFVLPAAPGEVLNFCFSAVETQNAVNHSISPLSLGSAQAVAAVGTRVIAFVSAQGGVGRSTLAEALGFELAARRSIRTLLYSFDLPSSAPLRLGTRFAPSAAEYLQRTEGGFKDSIQTTSDGLEVIIAPPESTHYAAAMKDGEQEKLHALVTEAYKFHYAAILLDLPSGESAWMLQPLRAASTILLVARPTTEGVRATGHMLRLLTEIVGAQYRFGRDAFFLILNQRTPKSIYTPTAFTGEVAKYAGWSPPVIATVDYDPAIPRAQDDGRPAAGASDTLGRAAATLVDTFYGNARGDESIRKSFSFAGLKFRKTG
jgi:MinD-like ATPase involved in chromosome partitioning or flagellar assembly